MLEVTSLGMRLAALGGSAAFHAGLAVTFVLAAHGRPASGGDPEQPALVEIAAPDVMPPALPEPAEPRANTRAAGPAFATHTHSYPVPPSHDATPHDPSLVHLPVHLPAISATDPKPAAPAAAPEALAASAPAPQFVMTLGHAAHAPGGLTASHGSDAPSGGGADEPVPESGVDAPARLLAGPIPPYPPAASEAAIEADVPLEIVVDTAGQVVRARALKHVGYGLDGAAERGVRAYRFTPAVRHGQATAVRMKWTIAFRLQ